MDSNKSPTKILPSLPEPLIVLISILFSSTILFTAGDNISFLSWTTSNFGLVGSGALNAGSEILTGSFFTLALPAPTEPRIAPTLTVVPSWILISDKTPDSGDGTATLTLSVSNSTTGSSAFTASPTFFNHLETVASVTDSPSVGTTKSFAIIL